MNPKFMGPGPSKYRDCVAEVSEAILEFLDDREQFPVDP
jgi:hypothetical protein